MKCLLALSLAVFSISLISAERVPSIAIIGGGIGGSGACHYARKSFEQANIYVFEPEEIGGRIKSATVAGNTFELGGHIIAEACKYMRALLQELKIPHKQMPTDAVNNLFDGKESIFQMGSDSSAMFSLLWQYGFGLSDVAEFVKQLDQAFANIYLLQDQGYAFTNLTSMLRALDNLGAQSSLLDLMRHSTTKIFTQKEFSEDFLRQVIQALEYRTYGQSVDNTNIFAGTLSLSAAAGGEITAIEGGTTQLPEKLIEECAPKVMKSRVAKIVKQKINDIDSFVLHGEDEQILLPDVDLVIVAAPQIDGASAISYEHARLAIPFTSYYVTIVEGDLNPATFEFASTSDQVHNIYSFSSKTRFYSIERLYNVNSNLPKEGVFYKVTSKKELRDVDLSKLFSKVRSTKSQKWDVAPDYKASLDMFQTGGNDELTKFEVDNNLFYITPIELMRSSMEHSLISARNAVLLARNNWYNTKSRNDKTDFSDDKTVLDVITNLRMKEEL